MPVRSISLYEQSIFSKYKSQYSQFFTIKYSINNYKSILILNEIIITYRLDGRLDNGWLGLKNLKNVCLLVLKEVVEIS
jgi:hypothetical protein